jgi:GNAT superfamily N-acetyltransferase
MTPPFVHSPEIVRRVRLAECRYTLARLRVLERLPGNPVGVEYKLMGDAFALSSFIPNSSFNRVVGLSDEQADEVPALAAWYASRKINGVFEINPGAPCPAVMAALTRAGYAQSGFHAVLFGAPSAAPAPDAGVSVEVVTAQTLEAFLDCYSLGWEVTNPEGFKTNVRGWLQEPGWTLYLGRYEGKPAGGAILYMDETTGYCADSAVDPAMRGHGVHQALLRRRLEDAGRNGADLVCAQAAYLSTSQRNMIRAGLAMLHTKAIWAKAA